MGSIIKKTDFSEDALNDVLANSLAEGVDDEVLDLLKLRALRVKHLKSDDDDGGIEILGAQELPRAWPEIEALGGTWIDRNQVWIIPVPKCADKLLILCACLRLLLNDKAAENPNITSCRARLAYNNIYNDTKGTEHE